MMHQLRRLLPERFRAFGRIRRERWRRWDREVERSARKLAAVEAAEAERRPDPSLRDSPLHELGERYRPSKRTHDYLRHYWSHFRDIRDGARRVVEIGVQTDRSIRMWEEFFPKAEILGIDIDPRCKVFEGGRRRVFIGDQLDTAFLERFAAETGGGFDVVIDDGLHTAEAILTSFSVLFPALAPRGIYAVEDLIHSEGVVEFFASLAHRVNHFPGDPGDWPGMNRFSRGTSWLTRNVTGVAFYRFLCFIQRGYNPEENPYLVELEDLRRWRSEAEERD